MKITINDCRQFCTEVELDTGEIGWETLDLYNVVIDNYINLLSYQISELN